MRSNWQVKIGEWICFCQFFPLLIFPTHSNSKIMVNSSLCCYRYAKCSTVHTPVRLDRPFSNGVTKVFKSLSRRLRPRIPRVVMFGSGLESIPLVRNMLWENTSPYRPVRLFPGKEGQRFYSHYICLASTCHRYL